MFRYFIIRLGWSNYSIFTQFLQVGGMQLIHSSELSMTGELINDRYQLNAELGQGGMGKIYQARVSVLECDVVISLVSGT